MFTFIKKIFTPKREKLEAKIKLKYGKTPLYADINRTRNTNSIYGELNDAEILSYILINGFTEESTKINNNSSSISSAHSSAYSSSSPCSDSSSSSSSCD